MDGSKWRTLRDSEEFHAQELFADDYIWWFDKTKWTFAAYRDKIINASWYKEIRDELEQDMYAWTISKRTQEDTNLIYENWHIHLTNYWKFKENDVCDMIKCDIVKIFRINDSICKLLIYINEIQISDSRIWHKGSDSAV